jgi:hypothetical protein
MRNVRITPGRGSLESDVRIEQQLQLTCLWTLGSNKSCCFCFCFCFFVRVANFNNRKRSDFGKYAQNLVIDIIFSYVRTAMVVSTTLPLPAVTSSVRKFSLGFRVSRRTYIPGRQEGVEATMTESYATVAVPGCTPCGWGPIYVSTYVHVV